MNWSELKGTYDAIFSLGELCLTSIQLEKNGLRPYAGPIDWMASYDLKDVNRLIQNRFKGFMDLEHLSVENKASDKLYLVKENYYNIFSNHDFYTHKNSSTDLASYPEVKVKYDRRIHRFLEKMMTSHKILFVRVGGSMEDVSALQETLSNIVVHDFSILLINHTPVNQPTEVPCELNKVCHFHFPEFDIWRSNDHWWSQLLSEIYFLDE
jgi:hypothetical protein